MHTPHDSRYEREDSSQDALRACNKTRCERAIDALRACKNPAGLTSGGASRYGGVTKRSFQEDFTARLTFDAGERNTSGETSVKVRYHIVLSPQS